MITEKQISRILYVARFAGQFKESAVDIVLEIVASIGLSNSELRELIGELEKFSRDRESM